MASKDGENHHPDDKPGEGERKREEGAVERSEPHVNAAPGTHDSVLHPDTPKTMQHDHEDAPGRQRYTDARPGDYGRDFQEDDSGSHPVKATDDDEVDEDGIPDIAARKPHEGVDD